MIEEYDGSFCLSDDGKDVTRELLQDIKEKYGGADWDIIKKYFDEKTIKPLSVDKWVREYQKLPENIQDGITSLSENIKRKKTVSQLTKEFIEILNTDKKIRKIIDDRFKYQTTLAVLSNRYTPKTVDLEDIFHKKEITDDERIKIENEAERKFKSPKLMFHINRRLGESHVGDIKGRFSAFIVAASGKLPPKNRLSMAIRGSSSIGKTDLIKTATKDLPSTWVASGTRFTRATLEDDIEPFKTIVMGEKPNNDDTVTDSLKQLTEDGLEIWKHDKDTNKLRDVKLIGRKASLYSSTEKESEEELATRYIVYTCIGHPAKYQKVGEHIKDQYGNIDIDKLILLIDKEEKPSWLSVGLEKLDDFDIIWNPYTKCIPFIMKTARSQRDMKRFWNIVAVITWLNQKNRLVYEKHGKRVLISTPEDIWWAQFLTEDIFRQTISNVDRDVKKFIDTWNLLIEQFVTKISDKSQKKDPIIIDKKLDEKHTWMRRSVIQEIMGVSRPTMVKIVNVLKNEGHVLETEYRKGGDKAVTLATSPAMKPLITSKLPETYEVLKLIEKNYLRGYFSDVLRVDCRLVASSSSSSSSSSSIIYNNKAPAKYYVDSTRNKIKLKHAIDKQDSEDNSEKEILTRLCNTFAGKICGYIKNGKIPIECDTDEINENEFDEIYEDDEIFNV